MNKTEFISFHEYLNSKGKMQEDPDVKLVATFDDEPTNSPEKYDGQKEKPSPYSNPTKKSKFIAEPEDGLGDVSELNAGDTKITGNTVIAGTASINGDANVTGSLTVNNKTLEDIVEDIVADSTGPGARAFGLFLS